MGLELYMVGVIVEDMARAAEFYRLLGVDVPERVESEGHVEVKMSGLTFFLSTKEANASGTRPGPRRQADTGPCSSSTSGRTRRSTRSTRS